MNKKCVFAALVAALAVGLPTAAFAESSVQLYGIVDAGVVFSSHGSEDSSSISTDSSDYFYALEDGVMRGSRWGIRGTEDLGGGISGIFNVEGGFRLDSGEISHTVDSSSDNLVGEILFNRRSVVGVSAESFGTITFGRDYTSGYYAALVTDIMGAGFFNSLNTFSQPYYKPGASGTDVPYVGGLSFRTKNGIFYTSPTIANGLVLHAHFGAGEESFSEPTSLGRQLGASLAYEAAEDTGLLGQAYWQTTMVLSPTSTAETSNRYEWGAGLGYKFGSFRVVAGYYEQTPPEDDSHYRAANLGVSVTSGQGELLGQAIYLEREVQGAEKSKATALGLAYVYSLSKRTQLFAAAGWTINEDLGDFPVYSATGYIPAGKAGEDPVAFSIGVNHSF